MEVWIFQTGEPLHCDDKMYRPMRCMNLADALVAAGHNVVIFSSVFFHQEKTHRSRNCDHSVFKGRIEIRLINSPGYSSNVGIGRLWDHLILAFNLWRHLSKLNRRPDVAFIGYPPIEPAFVFSLWLKWHCVPFLIDVKDLWPHIFLERIPSHFIPLARIFLSPYFFAGKFALMNANGVTSIASGALDWAVKFSGRKPNKCDAVVPLTTKKSAVSDEEYMNALAWWNSKGMFRAGAKRFFFVGSHSKAFDVAPVFRAAKMCLEREINCDFIICGDGECAASWEKIMSDLPNVFFPGWVNIPQIEVLARHSLATIAPYRNTEDFLISIPNKIIDSLSLGLPIITSLKGEVGKLVSENNVGLVYEDNSQDSLFRCIESIASAPEVLDDMSECAKRLYKTKFSYEQVYGGVVVHLEKIVGGNMCK